MKQHGVGKKELWRKIELFSLTHF